MTQDFLLNFRLFCRLVQFQNDQKFKRGFESFIKALLDPWNHRADISAQAYLKPFENGKKCRIIVYTEYIKKNFAEIPKIILNLILDIWFKYYGELNF